MRLSLTEINTIKACTHTIFGKRAMVLLFGSRINDQKRGHIKPLFDGIYNSELRFN